MGLIYKELVCTSSVGMPLESNCLYLQCSSVEHHPVSGSRSNRILQFRTGSGSDWISKKTQPDQIWISKLHWSLQ